MCLDGRIVTTFWECATRIKSMGENESAAGVSNLKITITINNRAQIKQCCVPGRLLPRLNEYRLPIWSRVVVAIQPARASACCGASSSTVMLTPQVNSRSRSYSSMRYVHISGQCILNVALPHKLALEGVSNRTASLEVSPKLFCSAQLLSYAAPRKVYRKSYYLFSYPVLVIDTILFARKARVRPTVMFPF